MFNKDVGKILEVITHPDNTPRHFDSIRKYVKLFYTKWKHLGKDYDENKVKVMKEYLNLINS
jgi:hypothetical protein|tara:strand:- start:996 stop:1181 length:186 start_codon:yes stop_codon:yes gene_type:complete